MIVEAQRGAKEQMLIDSGQQYLVEKDWKYRSIIDAAIDGVIIIDLETENVIEANLAACKIHGWEYKAFIGKHLSEFIHPDNLKEFETYLHIFQSYGEFNARLRHLRENGSSFMGEWRGTAFVFQGRVCLLGFVRDVSRRIQMEEQALERANSRRREEAKLLEISHTLAAELEFRPELILEQLEEIVGYTHAGLFALEDSTLVALAMRGSSCMDEDSPIVIHLSTPNILDVLFNSHRPTRIADVWSDSPEAQFVRGLLSGGAAVLLEGIISWMWVPLAVGGRVVGGISVADAHRNYFTPHHSVLALSVADQAAIAVVNKELHKNAQTLAVLEERQRLARSLHDAVNQSLFSAGLIAEVLPRLWERDQEEARRSVEDLRCLTRGAQAEMRVLLAELRPSTITDSNLGDLLSLLANALTGRTNIPVTITGTAEVTLPSEVQTIFYRVCQEALSNIAKHSKANRVDIFLTQEKPTIGIRIRDDGAGFDPEKIPSGHYGLSMMRERAEGIGATFSVSSQPDHGTEVVLRWTPPLDE